MDQQSNHINRSSKRPVTSDPTAWCAYWRAQNQAWRTEPEISLERQEELKRHRKIIPDIEEGIYPFRGMKLNRADVEWLLATHDGERGPVDWANVQDRERIGLDLRAADLRHASLCQLPLTKLRGGLTFDEYGDAIEEQPKIKIATVMMEGANLYKAQLEGANLYGVQLNGADLSRTQLEGADLRKAQLEGANLHKAYLRGANLREAQLKETNFWRAELEGVDLREAELEGADLYKAELEGADLREAELEGARLIGAKLKGARLIGARLKGANLSGAQMEGADLSGAQMEGARLLRTQLMRANLYGAQLKGANLNQAQLEGARLIGAQLEGAFLVGARLEGADLNWAQLERANLYRARLKGANLSGVQMKGANLSGAQMKGANLSGAQMEGANLYGAQMGGANLGRAQLGGSDLTDIKFGDERSIGPQLADVHWGYTNLAVVDWSQVTKIGDEWEAEQRKTPDGKKKKKHTRLDEYRTAVRGNRQLAVALQAQGLNEEASRFAYRAQRLQRIVLRRLHKFVSYLFSGFLDLIAGYGYRPGRAIIWYLLVIVGFATAYFVFGHLPPFPDSLIFSLLSFHGRGFFPSLSGEASLHNQVVEIAAAEAVVGLFIEISFIATFTQRFLAK